MKKINFFDKTEGELKNLALEAKKALVNLNVEREQRKLKDLHVLAKKKKDLARILTALQAKESTE